MNLETIRQSIAKSVSAKYINQLQFNLSEGIVSARKNYVDTNKISKDDFEKIVSWDPSPTKKYVDWLCKQFVAGIDPVELKHGIRRFVELSNKNLITNKDINSYSIEEFNSELGRHQNAKSKSEIVRDIKQEADKVYEDDVWLIVHPKTKEASCYYGAGTKWCTAATKSENHFDKYTYKEKTKLYYALNKKTDEKFAFAVGDHEEMIYDSQDKLISKNKLPLILQRFIKQGMFKAFSKKDKIKLSELDIKARLSGCTIDSDGFYSCEGDVDLRELKLARLPVKFKRVGGDFYCNNNRLTSLEGAPQSVGRDFYCGYNELTSLEGAPQSVGGYFYCNDNKLTSLEGAPQEVGGYFYCYHNKLTSLEGAPQSVGGNFDCSYNKLTSLSGAPDSVENEFICGNNNLPKYVKESYSASGYKQLRTEHPELFGLFSKNESIQIILEGITSAKKTYVDTNKISKDKFDKIVSWDPTPKKKYVDWLCKQFVVGIDPIELKHGIKQFDKLVNKNLIKNSDINSYSMEELNKVLGELENAKTKSEQKKDVKKDADKIYEDGVWLIVHPKTTGASCYYGKGTQWCTAATESQNYFNKYTYEEHVKLYYAINKKSDSKFAFAIYPKGSDVVFEIFNAEDNTINYSDLPEDLQKILTGKHLVKPFTNKEIKELDKRYETEQLEIIKDGGVKNDDGSYSFLGNVDVDFNWGGKELPFKFKLVEGSFRIFGYNLESFKNFPDTVLGSVYVFLSDKCKSFDGFIQSCPSLFIKDGGFKNLKGITQDCYDIVLYQIESLESLEGFPDLHGNGQVVLEALTNLTSLKGIGKGVNRLHLYDCHNIKSLDGLEHLDDDVQINLRKTYFNNVIGKNENANVVIKLGDLRELYPEFFTKANESVNEFDYSKMAKVALATAFAGTTPLLMNKLKDKTPEQKAQVLQTAVYDYKKQYNQNSNVTTKVTNVVGKDDESSKSIQDDFKSNGIDMDVIFTIESSNDPKAVNKTTNARGLGQLMKPTWIEVTARLNKKWSWNDAFDPEKNRTVATYYMNKRIPAMLKHYNIPDTVATRLAAYNWGVGNVKKAYDAGNYEKWIDKAPKETQDYIRKYYKYKSAKITESLHISLIAEKYKCIIRESLIDFPRVGLCSDVWKRSGKSYVLNQSVKDKITSILNDYDTSLIKDIKEIHVAGSIGTNQYDEDTDIDVHLILKEGSYFNNEDQQKLLFKWVKKQRDIKNYYINEHPFEVYIQMNPNQEYLSDALYDVLNDKWLKGPKLESLYFDPYIEYSSIIADVKDTAKDIDLEFGELRRDVIDYETIKSAIANQSYEFKVKLLDKLKIKLAEIEKDTRALLASKKKITDDRKLASQPTSIEQALSDVELSQTWKDKNATFKFMDRYRYLQMITDLEDIMKDKKVSDKEVDTIKKIVK